MVGLIQLPLNNEEQVILEAFLDRFSQKNVLLMYYLHRGKVSKALELKNSHFAA